MPTSQRPFTQHVPSPIALLVDRDADTRRMYAEFLERSAYEIDEASDGRDALVKALRLRPVVTVTETRLPGISGFDLCRVLREDSQTKDMAIVVVTADALASDIRRAEAAGADAVLTKPFLPDRLGSEIARLLSLSQAARARSRLVRSKAVGQMAKADDFLDRSRASVARRQMLSHTFDRRDTTTPPVAPPLLVCPVCDAPLTYVKSHVGGVSVKHQEQWDYFECRHGCGTFQHRQRTRSVRRIA